jgi:hypothetical protein
MMEIEKRYVAVDVSFDDQGKMTPKRIYWEDGHKYEIDKVLDSRQAASLKAGGQGIRYTVKILGKEKYLWFEEPKWFVEAKVYR